MSANVFALDVDWGAVTRELTTRGWARLERVVDAATADLLEEAAPGPWGTLPETEGGAGVRQAGRACHRDVADAGGAVRRFAAAIKAGVDAATSAGVPPLPAFNHVEWCQPDDGRMFITPHRDPKSAIGVVAVLTIRGRAPFRVWDMDGTNAEAVQHPERAEEWTTQDGDLVLMRGGEWPTPNSRRPVHEAQPAVGDRVTMTLRCNKGGFGADYFATA